MARHATRCRAQDQLSRSVSRTRIRNGAPRASMANEPERAGRRSGLRHAEVMEVSPAWQASNPTRKARQAWITVSLESRLHRRGCDPRMDFGMPKFEIKRANAHDGSTFGMRRPRREDGVGRLSVAS